MSHLQHQSKILYPDLSYTLVGILFEVHNQVGRYGREKQYCDLLETILRQKHIECKRENTIGDTGNRLDFLIEDKIVLECKAKPIITKEDYYQVQRYLQATGLQLGIIANFQQEYLRPKRIIRVAPKHS